MNVFISWSGERSHAVALVLHDWVMAVIQAAKPWISSTDIDRGAMWMSDINIRLHDSSVGIFCLTRENKNAPWILFEAGAIAKGMPTNRICTLLIDLEPTEITGPLGQFNHTRCNKGDIFKLAQTLNYALNDKRLEDAQLLKAFEAHWPAFDHDFAQALKATPDNTPAAPAPSTDDVLAEILSTVRALSKRVNSLEVRRNDHLFFPKTGAFFNTDKTVGQDYSGLLNTIANEVDGNTLAKIFENDTKNKLYKLLTKQVGDEKSDEGANDG